MTDDNLTVRRWGDGSWSAYRNPRPLPPEPAAPAQVQLDTFHPVFGARCVFVKWIHGFVPVGWIPARPATWAELFDWNGHRPPTVLAPPPVCEVTP